MKGRTFLALVPAAAALAALAVSASANPVINAEFELLDRPYSLDIPPGGSSWRMIPSGGMPDNLVLVMVQDQYVDNGDGFVSVGDEARGVSTHYSWTRMVVIGVGHLYRLIENDWLLMPLVETPGSPVGQAWLVLSPAAVRGTTLPVEAWTPVGHAGPEPQAGDLVTLGGIVRTLREIRLGVEGDFGTPAEPASWGQVKRNSTPEP